MTKSTKPEPLTPLQWEMAVGYGRPDRQDEFPLAPVTQRAFSLPQEKVLPSISLKSPAMAPCELTRIGCAGVFESPKAKL